MFNLKQQIIVFLQLLCVMSIVYADTTSKKRLILASPGTSLVHQAKFIEPVNPETKIKFTLWLKLRNKDQLDRLVAELYDPQSQNYQKFLTNDQFNMQYSPSRNTVNKVQRYVSELGMQAKVVNHKVNVVATAQQINKVFQVQINNYRYHLGTYYGIETAPSLDADIAQHISGITGLSNIPDYHPMLAILPNNVTSNDTMVQKNAGQSDILNMHWNSFVPSALPTTTSLDGISGANLKHTYQLANIPPVANTHIDGTGQTIVIIDACGTNDQTQIIIDANKYNTANGIPLLNANNFTVVNPDGSLYTSTCTNPMAPGWATEIAIDVEAAHTIAPGANIVLVLAADEPSLEDAVAAVITTITQSGNFSFGGFSNA